MSFDDDVRDRDALPMSTATKGRRREHQSRRLLEAAGYSVIRSAASKGTFDLVAVSATDFVLVQVKCNRPPSPAEREALALFRCPVNCKKLIHVWRDRVQAPTVLVI